MMIHGRLGREATLLKNGKYIKDLSYLNRDLKDVLYVDFDDSKAEFHKDNVLILPLWEGDPSDRELYDIMPFLESILVVSVTLYRLGASTWHRQQTAAETLWERRHWTQVHGTLECEKGTHH